jgi:hypothetical protein
MLKGPYRVISETIVADERQRHGISRMLRLKAVVFADGRVEVTGVFGGPLEMDPSRSVETGVMWLRILEVDRTPALGFRALLTVNNVQRVQLHRA